MGGGALRLRDAEGPVRAAPARVDQGQAQKRRRQRPGEVRRARQPRGAVPVAGLRRSRAGGAPEPPLAHHEARVEADSIFRNYCTQYLEQFDAEFARSDEEKRRKLLGPTMKRILEGGEDYDEFCRDIRAFAAENGCSVEHVSVDDGGWPDEIDW